MASDTTHSERYTPAVARRDRAVALQHPLHAVRGPVPLRSSRAEAPGRARGARRRRPGTGGEGGGHAAGNGRARQHGQRAKTDGLSGADRSVCLAALDRPCDSSAAAIAGPAGARRALTRHGAQVLQRHRGLPPPRAAAARRGRHGRRRPRSSARTRPSASRSARSCAQQALAPARRAQAGVRAAVRRCRPARAVRCSSGLRRRPGQRQRLLVHHRVGEAGVHQHVAEVVHVDEGCVGAGQPSRCIEPRAARAACPGPASRTSRSRRPPAPGATARTAPAGRRTQCSIMLAHSSSRCRSAHRLRRRRCGLRRAQRRGDHHGVRRGAARCAQHRVVGLDGQRARLRIGLRAAARCAAAAEAPPVEPALRRLQADQASRSAMRRATSPAATAARRRAPGAAAHARQRLGLHRASGRRAARRRAWAGSILSRCVRLGRLSWAHGAAAARGPVRGLPRLGRRRRCATPALRASRPQLPRCARCAPARRPARAAVRRLPAPTRRRFDACIAGCDYALPWDRADRALQVPAAASSWRARWRSGCCDAVRRDGGAAAGSCVLPVPLAPQRLARARLQPGLGAGAPAGARPGLPRRRAAAAARRDTRTRSAGARRSAQHNLRDAFVVDPPRARDAARPAVAVVDDVMTSGATRAKPRGAAPRRRGAASTSGWWRARRRRAD